MTNAMKSMEKPFEHLARWICSHRIPVLVIMGILILLPASRITGIVINASTEEMLREDDPGRVAFEDFQDRFGATTPTLIMATCDDLFTENTIKRLKALHHDLETRVPFVNRITSLVNARSTRVTGGILVMEKFLEDWPENGLSPATLKQSALLNPFYTDHLISKDGRHTAILIETLIRVPDTPSAGADLDDFETIRLAGVLTGSPANHRLTPGETAAVHDAITAVLNVHRQPGFDLTFTGGPVIVDVFNRTTDSDMKRFIFITAGIIIGFLALLFRRITGVIFPLVIVISAMLSTLGLMAFFKTPISMMTNVIPSFLTAVGIADAVHILAIFYRNLDGGQDRDTAICSAMGHSGLPVVLTSVTTAAGLLSFSLAELSTIADMGIYASAGVLLALVYTLVLLPAMIAVVPLHASRRRRKHKPVMDRVLEAIAGTACRHPIPITATAALLLTVSGALTLNLTFSSNILSYFPETHPARQALERVESRLNGSITLDVVIDSMEENGLHDPERLRLIDDLATDIGKTALPGIRVGNVLCVTDIVKELNQALNDGDPQFYTLPLTRDLIAQELLLFENSGVTDLEQLCDTRMRKTRISVKTFWADSVAYDRFVREIQEKSQALLGARAQVTVTGLTALLARTIPVALRSMARSYLIALAVITVLMLILLGNLKLGLLSMFPNLLPIVMVMGILGAMGRHLDINTMFIGSIALGLVVDDTIHFMVNFRKFLHRTGDPMLAVKETLLGSGRAMLITSVVLCGNFFILTTAELNHTALFGLYTGIVIALALLADFFLAPALMMLATRRSPSPPGS